jgi:hypothetical protein
LPQFRMVEGATCPVIPLATSAAEGRQLLRESMPGRTNPTGTTVRIPDRWDDVLERDPQRAELVPVALAALESAHEIWRFVATGPNGDSVEHQPHLIWCRPSVDAPAELCLAGTRRIDGELHLHTWFRLDDQWGAFRRYWSQGTREHPLGRVRPHYSDARDVLYLQPDPHVPSRVPRLAPRVSLFAYLDARVGYPALVGFEFQDARHHAPRLDDTPEIAGLLASSWSADDNVKTLAALLTTGRDRPPATRGD